MANPVPVEPVKVIALVLWSDRPTLDTSEKLFEETWGEVDFLGPDRPFEATTFYTDEMGPHLQRRLISAEKLVEPSFLPEAKIWSNRIEEFLQIAGARRVNIDIGYLDHAKIVLASMKPAGQKIYLERGVYADLTARYAEGVYRPFEWTFPDIKSGLYDGDFLAVRSIFMKQRKEWIAKR